MTRITPFSSGVVAAGLWALSHGPVFAQDEEAPAASRLGPAHFKVIVTVKVDGSILMDGITVSRDGLQAQFEAIASVQPQPEVHISSEAGARYGDVAFVMAAIQRAGIRRLGVIGGT